MTHPHGEPSTGAQPEPGLSALALATAIGANDALQLGLGYQYNLSRRTALYANASSIDNKAAATFVVPGGLGAVGAGQTSSGFEAGLRHVF